jgi:hypothetical protein
MKKFLNVKLRFAIQGNQNHGAEFYAKWLSVSVRAQKMADQFRQEARMIPILFEIEAIHMLGLGTTALRILDGASPAKRMFVTGEDINETALMAELGLLSLSGRIYRLSVPPRLTSVTVREALLNIASTIDSDGILHPEELLVAYRKTNEPTC